MIIRTCNLNLNLIGRQLKKYQRVFCKGQLCEQEVSSLTTRQELSSWWIPVGRFVDKKKIILRKMSNIGMNGWGKTWGHSSGNGDEVIDAGEI